MNRLRAALSGAVAGVSLIVVCPDLWMIFSLALAGAVLALLSWRRSHLVMAFGGLACGALLVACQTSLELSRRLPLQADRLDVRVQGRIVGIPAHHVGERGERVQFRLQVERWLPPEAAKTAVIATSRASAPAPTWPMRTLQLGWYQRVPPVKAGERWELTVRLRSPRGLGNPGSFDKAGWLFRERVHASGYVRRPGTARRLQVASGHSLQGWRARLANNLVEAAPDNPHVGLVQALTLGLDQKVPQPVRQILIESGTAHLLAISGLHVGLLATVAHRFGALVWWLGVGMSLRVSTPSVRANWRWSPGIVREAMCLSLAIPAATTYALLSGFALPTQRALVMLLVVAWARLQGRRIAALDGWLFALVLVIVLDPLSVLSPGLWLSFGAVALLLWMHVGHQAMRLPPGVVPTVWSRLAIALRMHGLLGIAMLPLSLWFFEAGPLVAPIANALAIPLVGLVIVPAALLGLLLAQCSTMLAGLVLSGLAPAFSVLLSVLQALAQALPPLDLALPGVVALGLSVLAVVLVLAPAGRRARPILPVLILPVLVQATVGVRTAPLELHVLDVGQGLAALVLTPHSTLIVDTGGQIGPNLTMASAVLLPYLRHLGRTPDRLLVSHADSDHARGVADLLAAFPALQIDASVPEDIDAPQAGRCQAGQSWRVDGVSFSILHPARHDTGGENDRSCVLLVHYGDSRVMLPGDIEAPAEARLVRRLGEALPLSVLLAPHHGSRSSSTAPFVEHFPTEHVVYPAGFSNRFGFPHPAIQMRYKIAGAVEHSTAVGGALRFRFDRSGLLSPPSAFWATHHRIWHGFRE